MSVLGRLRRRLRRWGLRHFALPLVNRELAERRLYLYRYVADADRLSPIRRISRRDLTRGFAVGIGSDVWRRALEERRLSVDVAIDVGVNHGYTSVWLSRWARVVHAFEPNPENTTIVREQLRIRQVDNVELHETAVADREGEATLHVKPADGHHSLGDIGASPTTGRRKVAVTTLDRFAEAHGIERVGLLKVDVEGFEPEVFEGAGDLLARKAIDLVLFEYSPEFYGQRGLDARAPLDVLGRFGYRITTLEGERVDPEAASRGPQVDLLAEPAAD